MKPGDTVIGYCHIGQQATAMLFAARTLGHPVLLYDGSFAGLVAPRRAIRSSNPTAREHEAEDRMSEPAADDRTPTPYLAGAGLGLVLLAAFVVDGPRARRVGRVRDQRAARSSPTRWLRRAAASSPLFARYLDGGGPWRDWLLFEIARRRHRRLPLRAGWPDACAWSRARAAHRATRTRLVYAFAGGAVMGLGAVLARGCTSGQALTGGALLSVGSWLFMAARVRGRVRVAPLVRRAWR